MSHLRYQQSYRRNLPHLQPPGASIFVTFRLHDSIPSEVMKAARQQRLHQSTPKNTNNLSRNDLIHRRRAFAMLERILDKGSAGPHWLRQPEVAKVVTDALLHLDSQKYDLLAYCVMSNHVHALFTPLARIREGYWSLASIMHSLKRFTGAEYNKLLRRRGPFWATESFDHYVRDEDELARIIQYILNNPVKAGLVDAWDQWP